MNQSARQACSDDVQDDHEDSFSSDSDTDDDNYEMPPNDKAHSQSSGLGHLGSLDDDALFDMVKKSVCTSLRQLISEASGCVGSSSKFSHAAGNTSHMNNRGAAMKPVTRLNISYFSEVLDSLDLGKRRVIESYGFESLLLFDKCAIPLAFAQWVVNHVRVSSWDIFFKGKSILITPQTVHDVLGIPIGGKTIKKASAECGKFASLRSMNMSRLPIVKACHDNIMKEGISDDDLVRNFLIVALVTFLCPNSNVHPSTEYLKPLVHIKKAEGWDWSKFVHYWLFKQIKKFNNERKKKDIQATKTMGGCLFVLCVVYIAFLKIGQQQLPPTLPRISVFKSDMIKQMAKLDCVQGHTYGKCHIVKWLDISTTRFN